VPDRESLFEQHREWAAKLARDFARRKLPPSFDPADLEQEARIECWRRAQKWDDSLGIPFQAYAYMYVLNAVRMACRRRFWAAATMQEIDPQTLDGRLFGEDAIEDGIQRAAVERKMSLQLAAVESALMRMPAVEAYLLKRVYLQGSSVEEISMVWSWSVSRVKRRLSNGVRLLRKVMRVSG